MTDIQKLISRASKNIKSAELLWREEDFESAVSRAYYAMFYAAEAVLWTQNLRFSSHKGVISNFGKHFIKTGIFNAQLGSHLRSAFDRRLAGDYMYDMSTTESEARETLEWAREFVGEVIKYLEKSGQGGKIEEGG